MRKWAIILGAVCIAIGLAIALPAFFTWASLLMTIPSTPDQTPSWVKEAPKIFIRFGIGAVIGNLGFFTVRSGLKMNAGTNIKIDQSRNYDHSVNIRDVEGIVNFGNINGDVTNEIRKVPDSRVALRTILKQLQNKIEGSENLSREQREICLTKIGELARTAQTPNPRENRNASGQAIEILKAVVAHIPDAIELVKALSVFF